MDEADIVSRISALETQVKTLESKTNILNDLPIKVTEVCTKLDTMIQAQTELGNRITALEREPGDRWQLATRTIITVVVTAALTYLGSKFMK